MCAIQSAVREWIVTLRYNQFLAAQQHRESQAGPDLLSHINPESPGKGPFTSKVCLSLMFVDIWHR